MNRHLIFSAAAVPLLVDASLKGAVLLALAGLGVLLMPRSSAAARHLVWLVAVLALLAVPVLSLVLPGWRVLPAWAVPPAIAAAPAPGDNFDPPYEPQRPYFPAPAAPRDASALAAIMEPSPGPPEPAAAPAAVLPPAAAPVALRPPVLWWRTALPFLWSAGCAALLLRLLGAHWLLRRAARRARAVTDGPLAAALAAAALQLGVIQRVRLLVEEKRTIPLVWGVWRPRLLLPEEALTWDAGQLQSVLLHELGHIRRRDPLEQWLTQLACALYWFNPLVWLAAWRLHVERERACDDLVLASGVRPSAYAEHLLHVATKLPPARWTAACGLAMARHSSLEGRLLAVLSEKLNRRSVTSALAALALLLGAGIAVPVAMLRAADDKWIPHQVAHIGTNDFSAYCVHDGKDAAFVIAYHGDFGSATEGSSNAKTRTWIDAGTINVKKPSIALTFHRAHAAPGKLSITTAPAEARDLSKPAPPPRDFGHKEYDLAQGRVFLLTDNGTVRQLDIDTPVVSDQESSRKLGALMATVPPQVSEIIPMKPNHKDAVALYEIWQRHERTNGDIPGALVGELAAAVKVFIEGNPRWETVPKLNAILPRLDTTHDWKPADAIALLDEVAAVQDYLLPTASASAVHNGEALLEKYTGVTWGAAQPNGLRAAWVLEPGSAEHRMGAALKARLLVQNTGSVAVMTRVPTWHQGGVSARDAAGAEVQISGIEWTTMALPVPVRLASGEFIEINAPGVGLGPRAGMGPWAGPRVGSNVLAKPGEELTLTHGSLELDGTGVWMRWDDPRMVGSGWWQAHIKARVARELPLPADAAERTHLLDRAVRELFGNGPTPDEIAAFATDQTDGAFDALVQRLATRADVVEFAGSLPTAPVKFRVLPADPQTDQQPRVVLVPGEYPVGEATVNRGRAMLKIVGRPVGDRRTNDAQLLFEPVEFTGILPPDPHKLEVPDGWGTWAIVCRPGDGFFYLLHKGGVRKIDYSAPREVTDTPVIDLPAGFRDEVKRQLDIVGVPDAQQAEIFEKPAPPADGKAAAGGAEAKPPERAHLWNDKYAAVAYQTEKDVNFVLVYEGFISSGMSESFSQTSGKWSIEGNIHLVDPEKTKAAGRNVDKRVIALKHTSDEPGTLYLDGKAYSLGTGRVFVLGDVGEPFQTARSMALRSNEDLVKIGDIAVDDMKRARPAATPAPKPAEASPRSDETPLQPKHEYAQKLFRKWQASARTDGKIPGALIGHVAREVDGFVKQSPDSEESKKLAALRPRIDASRDWAQAEVVALLDDITAISTAPVSWADIPMEFSSMRAVQGGEALPIELKSAAWGQPLANGLRAAWLLEPRGEQYPLGSVLKARVLFHNTGKVPVVFKTETWHQHDGHTARDAKGAEIPVKATWFTGITPMATLRLAPGEYCEVSGHGIAIGAGEYKEEHSTGAVGAVIEAKEGDAVTLSHSVDTAYGGWTRPGDPKDPLEFWKATIAERIANEAPMPASAADRAQLIRRVTLDILGVVPTAGEIAAFTADDAPDALAKLTARLQAKPRVEPFSGKLPTGEMKFRVIAADPDAAKAPRIANSPGRYVLGDNVHLLVSQLTGGDKRTNKAVIAFLSPDPKVASPQ